MPVSLSTSITAGVPAQYETTSAWSNQLEYVLASRSEKVNCTGSPSGPVRMYTNVKYVARLPFCSRLSVLPPEMLRVDSAGATAAEVVVPPGTLFQREAP